MNIILAPQITDHIRERYLLLELDSFRTAPGAEAVAAFCLIEQLGLDELLVMQQYLDLHDNLMPNYRQRNWNYVEQAVEHLMGRWDQQLDSFYQDLLERVNQLRSQQLDADWDGVVARY